MSITAKNILITEVKNEWIVKGCQYAEKSWPYTYNRMGKSNIYQRLRNIVKGVIAQEALGFLLAELGIKYETKPRERWYDVNRFDYLVNTSKRQCSVDVKSFFVVADNPEFKKQGLEYFMDCSALVPKDQLEGREMENEDIYVFAFIVGREHKFFTSDLFPAETKWLVHCMWEYEFFKPPKYLNEYGNDPLGTLGISCRSKDVNKKFVLGGTCEEKKFYFEKIDLGKKGFTETTGQFFQLFFIRPIDNKLPEGEIKIEANKERKVSNIPSLYGFDGPEKNGWEDIWIYDAEIHFCGFSKKKYFKENAELYPRFSKTVKQFEPKTDNYGILIKHLPSDISSLKNALS